MSAPTAWRLLTGSLSDAEYFRSLQADRFGLYYDVPKPGWRARHARIRRAVLEVLAFAASILMLIFVVWATAGASLPGNVR